MFPLIDTALLCALFRLLEGKSQPGEVEFTPIAVQVGTLNCALMHEVLTCLGFTMPYFVFKLTLSVGKFGS